MLAVYESESNESRKSEKIETPLCAAAGTASNFHGLERIVYGKSGSNTSKSDKAVPKLPALNWFVIQFITPYLHALKCEHNRHTVSYVFRHFLNSIIRESLHQLNSALRIGS